MNKKLIAAALLMACSAGALAQPPADTPVPAPPAPTAPAVQPAKELPVEASVPAAVLDAERGKADTVTNDARLQGVVSGNSAVNVATGSNHIDSGSFAAMSGLPVVIQNTGANVLIQNATIIHVQFR